MIRAVMAYSFALLLAVTGLSLAHARGTQPEAGIEVAICSGVEMVTITIGPDGEPVEETHICPDGNAMFLAAFAMPALPGPELRLVMVLGQNHSVLSQSAPELSPSARGPPDLV